MGGLDDAPQVLYEREQWAPASSAAQARRQAVAARRAARREAAANNNNNVNPEAAAVGPATGG